MTLAGDKWEPFTDTVYVRFDKKEFIHCVDPAICVGRRVKLSKLVKQPEHVYSREYS